VTTISWEDFEKVDMRIGTIISAARNEKAAKPSYILEVDFGPLGIKTSSAQITQHYTPEQLIGMQVMAVVNFPVKHIAGVKSEVLVMGAISVSDGVVLMTPTQPVENGARLG